MRKPTTRRDSRFEVAEVDVVRDTAGGDTHTRPWGLHPGGALAGTAARRPRRSTRVARPVDPCRGRIANRSPGRPGPVRVGPQHGVRGQLRAAVTASAAPHGYTLALWTATAVTSSDRGAPGGADVLALLAGATLAFVALAAVAHGGAPMMPERSAPAGTRIWAAFHLPMAACAALASLLLTRCCSGPCCGGSSGRPRPPCTCWVSAPRLPFCFAVRRHRETTDTQP